MKRISVVMPAIGQVSIGIPSLSKEVSFESKLLKFMTYLLGLSFFSFLITLPLGKFIYPNLSTETSYFYFFVYFMVLLVSILLGILTLGGSKSLVDPKGFVAVLFFALISTTAAVAVNEPNINNTFGKSDIRGLGGLAVMTLVFLFYVSAYVIRDLVSWRRAFYAISIGALFFMYTFIFSSVDFYTYLVGVTLSIILLSVAHYKNFWKFFAYVILATLIVLPLATDVFGQSSGVARYVVAEEILLLAGFIASCVVLLIYVVQKRDFVVRKLVEYLNLFSSKSKESGSKKLVLILNHSFDFVVTLIPAVLLGIFLFLWIDRGLVDDIFRNSWDEVKAAWDLLNSNAYEGIDRVKNVAVGFGGRTAVSGDSYLANVLRVQGVLGVVAYLGVWGWGIRQAYKALVDSMSRSSDYKLISSLFIILVAVPIVGLFSYVSMFLIIIWWLALSLVCMYIGISEKNKEKIFVQEDFAVREFKFKKKFLNILLLRLRSIFAMLILVGAFVLIRLLHNGIS